MSGLRDMDGLIVIDEREAREDMKNIREAKAKLEEAMKLIDPSKLDDARMLGSAREALGGQFQRIYKNLANFSSNSEGASLFIEQTVTKYQRIDRELVKIVKEG